MLFAIPHTEMHQQAACREVVQLVVLDQEVGTVIQGMKWQLM